MVRMCQCIRSQSGPKRKSGAGINETQLTAATLPQLQGFTAYPTLVFLGRDGRVRHIHAGFYGPALGEQHARLVKELHARVEELLHEN